MTTIAEMTAKPMDRRTMALDVIAAINLAIDTERPREADLILALCERIKLCNDPRNIWIASDLHSNATGELYTGNGRFWSCCSKLCQDCMARQSRKNRRRVQDALDRQRMLVGEEMYFITLTMPKPNVDLITKRKVLNYAWTLLRKRRYWIDSVKGYAKSEEFTHQTSGFHYHAHLIVRSRYLKFQYFRQIWTECLIQAFIANGLEFYADTKDGFAIVNIQKCYDIPRAIRELSKYITKNSSWSAIPAADLIDFTLIERFPRMFELGGCYRDLDNAAHVHDYHAIEAHREAIEDAGLVERFPRYKTFSLSDLKKIAKVYELTIVHTGTLSDGNAVDRQSYWRNFVRENGRWIYLDRLQAEIAACVQAREYQLQKKYPFATFRTLAKIEPLTVRRPAA